MPEDLSPQQSLALIQNMIGKARVDLSKNRFYFLLWGWFAFLAMITQFVVKTVFHFPYHYLVWSLSIPVTIITIIRSGRDARRSNTKTYVGESMGHLWMGLGISFFILIFILSSRVMGWQFTIPLSILFYGLGTFVSGRILQFKPFVVGGIINWVLACIAVYIHYDYQLLLGAVAVLCSYLVPAYLLSKIEA